MRNQLSSQPRSLRLRSRTTRARRVSLECLEGRELPSGVIPNDPGFPQQWDLHDTGQVAGDYDADIDMPAAWSITTGSTATVVAVLDVGVDYTDPDLYLNVWLNQGEIPAGIRANLIDTDGDGLITFRDLNAPADAASVTDGNGNGYIDGGDLLRDTRWANGLDEDGNGKTDDLIGWDTLENDNDPSPLLANPHGTYMSTILGAVGNNGSGTAGVMWEVQLLPVRIKDGSGLINENAAAGLDYAVAMGATISNDCWGSYAYSQVMYDAINRARSAGHLLVAPAGNDVTNNDASPFYPASYGLDNVISVLALDAKNQLSFVTNWGAVNVDLGASSPTGATSSATPHVTGVAGLLRTLHPDWTYAQIKSQILATVDSLPSLAGKCVTGGRLNAAATLATTSISISDPTRVEGASGTAQVVFTVTRVGVDTGSITLNWSTANGTATAGSDYAAASGQITFAPSGGNTQTITVTVNGDLAPESSETFFVTLAVASGNALLADDDGQGTILDSGTKFYVVDDASNNRTYEYGALGASGENYVLNGGNAAPRGAASTAAGDKVWVVDANKNVYVYNTGGGLLGSWTASSLASNATVEGITTNGTDVWIVDAKQDKVYRYTGAASRLSGSQNAVGSFSLNSGNTGPKDIVTDGTSLWVVNDSTTDKVFKYDLSGSLLGSWTITGAGTSPTGITLDPTGGGTLWVVDSGTDRVYQFEIARGLTSGSRSPSTSFALAAGNTNPQGIADPPMPAPGASRAVSFTTTFHPSAHLATHLGKTLPGLLASKSNGSSVSSNAATPSILGPQVTPILTFLAPSTDQDLTLMAAERLRTGTKRTRTAPRA
jgi:hypothetical protein